LDFAALGENVAMQQRRCPYLEQILKSKRGPITRYRADCHVDHRTHSFTFLRNPTPPCLTDYETCPFYQQEHDDENRRITRYTD
jgi:hypothetical protein